MEAQPVAEIADVVIGDHRHALLGRRMARRRRQPQHDLRRIDPVDAFDGEAGAGQQIAQFGDGELVDPAQRLAVERRQIGGAIAHHHRPAQRRQPREECRRVVDVFQHAQHGDDIAGAGLGKFALVEVAHDGAAVARHQIARLVGATRRQELFQRHGAAAQIEHMRADRNVAGGLLRACVPGGLELRRVRPARRVGQARFDHLAAALETPGLGELPIWVPLILSLAFAFTIDGKVKKLRKS